MKYSDGQAGTEGIQITHDMIEAGVKVLLYHTPEDIAFPNGGAEIAVEAVLKASLSMGSLGALGDTPSKL
jgi:putative NIF3 family GTP cyclohydrolase 1 type 2